MRIAWSIGHHPGAKGAYYPILDEWEHDIAREVVDVGVKFLRDRGHDVIVPPSTGLSDKIAYINANKPQIAIESHFNSSSFPNARGCETLYFSFPVETALRFSAAGKKLAEFIQEETIFSLDSASLPRRTNNRGAKGMADIRRVYNGKETIPRFAFLTKTKMPAVICEPLFLSNAYDSYWLTQDREAEIRRIALGVVNGVLRYNNESPYSSVR